MTRECVLRHFRLMLYVCEVLENFLMISFLASLEFVLPVVNFQVRCDLKIPINTRFNITVVTHNEVIIAIR